MGREAIIKATTTSTLEWAEDGSEKPVDRITALGIATAANELGAAIVHAQAIDEQALRKALLLVVRELVHRRRVKRSIAESIAIAALYEYMRPTCTCCGGLAHLYHEGKVVRTCDACNGSGVRRYTDKDRAELVGIGKYPRHAYEFALDEIRDAMNKAIVRANKLLTI